MAQHDHAWTLYRRRRPGRVRLVALLLVAGAAAALAHGHLASPSDHEPAAAVVLGEDAPPRRPARPALAGADGALPDGTSVFDDAYAGVANLDPALLEALRRAATDAAAEGVTLEVESGWRSPGYQRRLLREAVVRYGSAAEAARWVATPETSAHVSGDAADIAPRDAADWLARNGAAHGLCRTYDNEPWHFELRPDAPDLGCPPTYPDPTHDPRMAG